MRSEEVAKVDLWSSRLTFGHQGHFMKGSHVRKRGTQIEESGIFSVAV